MKATCSDLWRKAIYAVSNLGNHEALGKLGDFTTTPRIILISMMAIGIGILSAFQLVGMISLNDLLKAWVRSLEEERLRERVLRLRLLFPSRNEEKIKQN